jgi:hypothetical protein
MPVILTTLEEINLQVFVSAPRRMTRHLKWQEFPNCDVTLPDREWPVNVESCRSGTPSGRAGIRPIEASKAAVG